MKEDPCFSELNKVRVTGEEFGDFDGYEIASMFKDERWIHKMFISEDPRTPETLANWIPEEFLERVR